MTSMVNADIIRQSREFFDLPEAIKTQKIMNKDPVGYDGHKATTCVIHLKGFLPKPLEEQY